MITCHFCREGASVGIISGPNRRGPPNTRVHTGGLFISMHCRTAAITSMVYIPKCNIKIFRCLYKRSYNESLGTEPFVRRPPSLPWVPGATLRAWRCPAHRTQESSPQQECCGKAMSSSLLHLLLAAALVRIVERAALVEVVARVGPGGVYAYTHIYTRADIYRAWTWRAHGGGVGSTTVELGAPLLSTCTYLYTPHSSTRRGSH